MPAWFGELDRLVRGETTQPDHLAEHGLDVQAGRLLLPIVLFCVFTGLCTGSYSLLKEVPQSVSDADPNGRYWQLLATSLKVPALFFLTLAVTLPSLYVSNALVGSRLRLGALVRLLLASLAVNTCVLASLGPIVLFFSVSTKSYPFVQLLNVVAFGIAGVLGLMFLLQTLHRITTVPSHEPAHASSTQEGSEPEEEGDSESRDPSGIEMPQGQVLARHTRLVFRSWVVLFAVVGAQMAWVLRPFIGNPGVPFSWLRERQSNFFTSVLRAFWALLSGDA